MVSNVCHVFALLLFQGAQQVSRDVAERAAASHKASGPLDSHIASELPAHVVLGGMCDQLVQVIDLLLLLRRFVHVSAQVGRQLQACDAAMVITDKKDGRLSVEGQVGELPRLDNALLGQGVVLVHIQVIEVDLHSG